MTKIDYLLHTAAYRAPRSGHAVLLFQRSRHRDDAASDPRIGGEGLGRAVPEVRR